jgi:hypothetical protein
MSTSLNQCTVKQQYIKTFYAPQTDMKIKYAPVINMFRELKVCKEGPISKRKGTVLVVEARPYHTSTP